MAIDTSPAEVTTNALQAIPFSSLIGGPLDACINAQAMAAKTSWEFIQNVGLTKDPQTGETKAINVTFQYNKNGQMTNLVVPLLTIVPIPFLSINNVSIDFLANISASASTSSTQSSSEDLSTGGKASGKIGWGPFSMSFEASANYSSKKDSKATQESKYSVEYTMNVHVDGGQADMPAGMATVLNILQSSVTDTPIGGSLVLSPKQASLIAKAGAMVYVEATIKDSHGVLAKDVPVTFVLNADTAPTDLTLKPIEIVEGTVDPNTTPTATKAIVLSNEKGVVGINLIVDTSTDTYAGGRYPLNISAKIVDPDQDGKEIELTDKGVVQVTEHVG